MQLSAFFDAQFAPTFLVGAAPRTFKEYSVTLRKWRRLTADKPIDQVATPDLAEFKAKLLEEGHAGAPLARATVNKHLRHVGALLAKAGPPGPKNRDALALIPRTPWVRPLKEAKRLPRRIAEHVLAAVYAAAEAAIRPRVACLKPPTWWRALIVLAYTAGFRRGSLLAMRWNQVDLQHAEITIDADDDKCRVERRKPLHSTAVRHLLRIRVSDGHVFPWPHGETTWYRDWHALQAAAGIPRVDHIGLHDLKRAAGTIYAAIASPWAVQQMLDHSSIETARHYVNPTAELRPAVDAFPVPDCFRDDHQPRERTHHP